MCVVSLSLIAPLSDGILMLLRRLLPLAQWLHPTTSTAEWVYIYFTVLFPLTFHSELRRRRGSPEGVGQEEAHLLDA